MQSLLNSCPQKTKEYLLHIENVDSKGLISNALEWIYEGWGIETLATPEQVAAALFMEARTQDQLVRTNDSSPEFPKKLREIGYEILRLQESC